jgi:hypothetical protein
VEAVASVEPRAVADLPEGRLVGRVTFRFFSIGANANTSTPYLPKKNIRMQIDSFLQARNELEFD